MTCNKVLYDSVKDCRENIFALTGKNSEKIKKQASSVACFVSKTDLPKDLLSNKYKIAHHVPSLKSWIQSRYKTALGDKEPFGNEKTLAYGTGFLVAQDTLLTAAHVVCTELGDLDKKRIGDSYIVFDYLMMDADNGTTSFEENQVYTIKRVIGHCYRRFLNWEDWCLVKLDRKVAGREPLALGTSQIQKNWELYMLGYPIGTPLKCTLEAVIMNDTHAHYFECKVDAFGGNSGSPLIKADTGEVVGILCEGNADFVIDGNYEGKGLARCVSNRLLPDHVKRFEKCQRVTTLAFAKEYIERALCGFKLQQIERPLSVWTPGLHVLVQCQNFTCSSFDHAVWMNLGTGTFFLEEVLYRSACVMCKQEKVKVADVGIHGSRFEVEGELAAPKKAHIHKQSVVQPTKFKTLDQGPAFSWKYLKIHIIKL